MKKIILFCTVALALSACLNGGNQPQSAATESCDIVIPNILGFDPETGIAEMRGHLDSLGVTRVYKFEADSGRVLSLALTTDSIPANVRINQIISPSSVSDGPFGQSLDYSLVETGEWTVIVGGSLMQGDDYRGGFSLKATLK